MESFKYKGTPEQMQKVADYLLAQGYKWWDDDRWGEAIYYDAAIRHFFYTRWGDLNSISEMPSSLELAIFGKTEGISGKVENEWIESNGLRPLDTNDKKVDYKMANEPWGRPYHTDLASDLIWDKRGMNSDITHWRFHKSDEDYFKKPETAGKKVYAHVNGEDIAVSVPINTSEQVLELLNFKQTDTSAVVGKVHAVDILNDAATTIGSRAVERDKGDSERSMLSTVNAFNALTKHTLTEEQGWLFMVVLKMARSQGGCFKLDDYLDGAAYFALAGESAAKVGEV